MWVNTEALWCQTFILRITILLSKDALLIAITQEQNFRINVYTCWLKVVMDGSMQHKTLVARSSMHDIVMT